jgi:hypothetical protein
MQPVIGAQEAHRFLTSGVSLVDQLYEWDSSAGWVHYLGKRREGHDWW